MKPVFTETTLDFSGVDWKMRLWLDKSKIQELAAIHKKLLEYSKVEGASADSVAAALADSVPGVTAIQHTKAVIMDGIRVELGTVYYLVPFKED